MKTRRVRNDHQNWRLLLADAEAFMEAFEINGFWRHFTNYIKWKRNILPNNEYQLGAILLVTEVGKLWYIAVLWTWNRNDKQNRVHTFCHMCITIDNGTIRKTWSENNSFFVEDQCPTDVIAQTYKINTPLKTQSQHNNVIQKLW